VDKDVTEVLDNVPRVVVEEVNLELEEGEFFDGRFFYEGKLHGKIWRGFGSAQEPTEEYPIYGLQKGNLYTLDENNNIEKTEKKIMGRESRSSDGTKSIVKKIGKDKEEIYIGDLKAENSEYIRDTELERLLLGKSYSPITYYFVPGNDNYIYFNAIQETGMDAYLGIYDRKNKQLYEVNLGKKEQFKKKYENGETYFSSVGFKYSVFYSGILNSLMVRDKDNSMCYKITLNGEEIELSEYMDLNKLNNEKVSYIEIINDSEILLFYEENIDSNEEDRDFNFKVYAIGKYNFATKEFKTLFEAGKEKNIQGSYLGKNLFLLEEFEEKDKARIYKTRYILKLEGNEIRVIFKENIEDEKYAEVSWSNITVNEGGNEIFLTKSITVKKEDIETIEDAVYKRYIIEE